MENYVFAQYVDNFLLYGSISGEIIKIVWLRETIKSICTHDRSNLPVSVFKGMV